MRRLAFISLGFVLLGMVFYAFGLGVYAVSSTATDLQTQPRTPEEARATLDELGLGAMYPFASRFVDTPHGRMHYVEKGSGPVVLCLHGNPTWSFLYRDFVKGLSGSARVVAPDLIGFGLSSKPSRVDDYSIEAHIDDVSALIEARNLRDITLVVQDWGGPIGIGAAMRHPDRIKAIVAMNTIAYVPGDGDWKPPLPLRVMQRPVVGELLVQGFGVFNRQIVQMALNGGRNGQDDVVLAAYDRVQGNWQERAGTLAFPRWLPSGPDHPVVPLLSRQDDFLRGFAGPVLLVWGLRDPVFGSELAAWRERFPKAQVLELPDAGHYLQEDAAERIVPRIRQFLRETH